MDYIHHQSCNVIGPLLSESQSHLMIDDVHSPPTMIFQTLVYVMSMLSFKFQFSRMSESTYSSFWKVCGGGGGQ